ncbi:MAG: extracellular solute-binding protein [Roseiflexus sp.]
MLPLAALYALFADDVFAACRMWLVCTANSDPTPEPRVLRVYTVRNPTIEGVVAIISQEFRARNPDVTIEFIYGDGSYSELQGSATTGNIPDVIWLPDVITPALIEAELLLDLEEFARGDRSVVLEDVHPVALELGRSRVRPGLYLIPASLETIQMYYNRSLWDRSGAPLPRDDWTWDDLIAACRRLQESTPGVDCLSFTNGGLFDHTTWVYWLPWVRGAGGDVLSADGTQSTLSTPQSLEGLQGYLDLWLRHRIAAKPDAGREDCFVAQTCAAFFSFAGAARIYREQIGDRFAWDVQMVPAHRTGRFTGIGTYGFAVARASREPQLAWDFVKSAIMPETQHAIAAAYLGPPVLLSLSNDPAVLQLPPPPTNMRAFIVGREAGITPPRYPTACGSVYNGPVFAAIADAFDAALREVMSVESAFTVADRKIQTCLDANR